MEMNEIERLSLTKVLKNIDPQLAPRKTVELL